jgi:hypothetical protein
VLLPPTGPAPGARGAKVADHTSNDGCRTGRRRLRRNSFEPRELRTS